MKKFLTILLSVVLVATLCFAVACQSHTWATEWSSDKDNHWHACLDEGCDEKSDEAPHVDADNNNICDVCKKQLSSATEDPCKDGHTVATWTDAGNGKHSGKCSVCNQTITENHVGTGTCTKCNATLGGTVTPDDPCKDGHTVATWTDDGNGKHTGTCSVCNNAITENHVDLDANKVCDKCEANLETIPEPPVGTTYTIYYYAPEWTEGETVYLYTYGDEVGSLGALNGDFNGITLTAVAGRDGWYSVEFTTDKEFTSAHIVFHDLETSEAPCTVRHEFYVDGLTGTAFYFIANANNVYTSEDAATEAYDAIANGTTPALPDPAEDEVRLTLYVHVNTEKVGTTVNMYSWVNIDEQNYDPLGGWPGTAMTAIEGQSGWYLLEANVKKTYTAFALIVNGDGQYDAVTSFSMTDNGKYIGKYKDIIEDSVEDVLASETEYENSKGDPISVTIHVQVDTAKAGAGPYYVYAWATGKDEIFGGWSGTQLTAEVGHDGWYSFTTEIDDSLLGVSYNYIINNGDAQYNSASVTLTADNLEVWITIDNVASFTAPTGYNTETTPAE
ncbi:MAG: hypothetical protein K2M64_03750 [Clostridia bacterium]|nr:hypothetical protein [Clostridia bacterium]